MTVRSVRKVNTIENLYQSFEIINIDILSLDKTYFLTVLDQFSKHAQMYHLTERNAINILNNLIKYFETFRIPKTIISNSGSEFKANVLQHLFKIYNIEKVI